MKTIGFRITRPLSDRASSVLLAESARFNDDTHRLPTGHTTFFPKGVYRYKSHDEAERHWLECIATGMASLASHPYR
jgi:hypothetical protein